ncbi:MAG: tetratricopeptide repeat protein [Thermoguttaceae bacterium]|jgi:tetratricopeptide (TPR) repeat protein|nr:tetratricopeptide repeat protein [Thermoguttaceae bacterium]
MGGRIRSRQLERQAEGYLELGMAQHAMDTLSRLGPMEAYTPNALCLCGEALRELERYEEALVPLTRAAESDPTNIRVWLALGWCHKRTSRLDLAIGDMERALEYEPTEALLHYNLACYLSLAGQKERAIAHLSKALAIDSDYRAMIETESDFDPIRSDPEFQALTGLGV